MSERKREDARRKKGFLYHRRMREAQEARARSMGERVGDLHHEKVRPPVPMGVLYVGKEKGFLCVPYSLRAMAPADRLKEAGTLIDLFVDGSSWEYTEVGQECGTLTQYLVKMHQMLNARGE